MSARDRIIITVSIAVFAGVIGYWALLRPSTGSLVASKRTLAQMQDELQGVVGLRTTRVQHVMHAAGMWTAEESSGFVQQLARLAATHRARLVNVNVADPRRVNPTQQGPAGTIDHGLFEVKVTADFEGAYPAIRRLVAALHDHRPRLRLTQVTLAAGQGSHEITVTTEIAFFVFQPAAGAKPIGPTPKSPAPPETVAVAGARPSPFGQGLGVATAPETPAEAPEADVSASVTVPPDLPEIGPGGPGEDSPQEEELPRGPRPVLAGVVGREGWLLAAISLEGRTRLYAAGDKLSENATLAVVRAEGVQITVHGNGTRAPGEEAERNIVVRTGQPITGVEIQIEDGGALPDGGPLGESSTAFPVSAGTVSGRAGAIGLVREQDSIYFVRAGDVIAGRLQVVAIADGDVYVADAEADVRQASESMTLPRGGG